MMIVLYVLAGLVLLTAVYLFCICPGGRTIPTEMRRNYAHRGLFGGGIPENSLTAFDKAAEAGYGIELDVQLSADGEVVVFHDASLERMTGVRGKVSEYTLEQLKTMTLAGTQEQVPTLREVLTLTDGRVPLLVELKGESTDTAVCTAVDAILRTYTGAYLVESFNPLLLRWYKKHHPAVLRGQLTTSLTRGLGKTVRNRLLDTLVLNVVTRPDFLAYDRQWPERLPLRLCLALRPAGRFIWTIRSAEEYSRIGTKDTFAIFEQFCPPIVPDNGTGSKKP